VDCEQAANLISARIDGEIDVGDDAALDAHLAGCAACRAAMEYAPLQDAALVRAFAGGRDAAARLAARVAQRLAPPPAPAVGHQHWLGWAAAAAAAIFIVVPLFMRPPRPRAAEFAVQPQPAELVAHLSLASGEVFKCPSGGDAWKPIAPGEGLEPGAKIRTADAAKCELSLPDGSRVRLNSATELKFTAATDVHLDGGQIFSAVGPDAAPLRIAAGSANVTTAGPGAAQLDVARPRGAAAGSGDSVDSGGDSAATVTVVAGAAQVHGGGRAMTVRGGEFLRVATTTGDGLPFYGCKPVADPLQATRWLDDLLLLLPADNEELLTRVDLLLSRITAERAARASAAAGPADATPGPVEHDLRARGQSWAPPIARYAARNLAASTEAARANRRTAARLLADLAPPACVEDLIPLLADGDPEVRFHAAAALNRLTGQTLGFSPDACAASPRDSAPLRAWQDWWQRNRARYPARAGAGAGGGGG
jgi:hypothetical protein